MQKKRIDEITKDFRREISFEAKIMKKEILMLKLALAISMILLAIITADIVYTVKYINANNSPQGIYMSAFNEAKEQGWIK